VLLVLHAALLAWGDTRHSPTIDEVGHLPAALCHWQTGRFDLYRVNPPLVRVVAALPVLVCRPSIDWRLYPADYRSRQEFEVGREFIGDNGERSFWYFTLARWACIPFSLLGGYVCWRWAGEVFGGVAGLLALALWCFCPNVLAHGQMITPDVGAAALGVAAQYCFWRWLKEPDWGWAYAAGAVLGLAELTKMTWTVLFLLWPLLWLAWRWPQRRTLRRSVWLGQGKQLLCMLALAFFLINAGYGFEGSFERLGDYTFTSKPLSGQPESAPAREPGNRFAGGPLGRILVPFPQAYVMGIDGQKADFEEKYWSYLGGDWRKGGWWYYYLYGLAVKVPLGTWLLALLAVGLACGRGSYRAPWRDELTLLAPAVVILALVSSQTGFNHHLRYVLPVFPFAFILISRVGLAAARGAKTVAAIGAAALAWSVVSSLLVYPHNLSYFNELVGGPTHGGEHLVDSNLDWGQDLLELRRWLAEHPEARSLGLVYFGGFDPVAAGLEFTLPPPGPVTGSDRVGPGAVTLGPRPGWFAVSETILRGYGFGVFDGKGGRIWLEGPGYAYFQHFRPVARAGYSIVIYSITAEEANRVRTELGLPPLPTPEVANNRPAAQ
jgi:hypothetical protein